MKGAADRPSGEGLRILIRGEAGFDGPKIKQDLLHLLVGVIVTACKIVAGLAGNDDLRNDAGGHIRVIVLLATGQESGQQECCYYFFHRSTPFLQFCDTIFCVPEENIRDNFRKHIQK